MSADFTSRPPLDLAMVREKLSTRRGEDYWRSLEELAATPEFEAMVHREFPENASEWNDAEGRRNFLKLMGASLALAGLSACTRQPTEKIVPYVRAPEEFIPGKPLNYATAVTLGGYATGVLVESHMGRPTKIEGNELHPASLGATDIFTQAEILSLYDPDRSQVVKDAAGRISTWSAFLAAAGRAMQLQKAKGGKGLRILTETVSSPTLAGQIEALRRDYPEMKWHQWEPAGRDMVRAGARLAFGAPVETRYDFAKAKVVLSLEADFLCGMPGSVRYARDFSSRRRVETSESEINRLYVVENTPSNTGAMADHRLPVRSFEVEGIARALAAKLGVSGFNAPATGAALQHAKWIDAVVRDLQRHRGACIVIAGDQQTALTHALVHAINAALGNAGATILYTDPVEANPVDQVASITELAADMAAGRVEVLFILGGNPVYNAPVDLNFGQEMSKVSLRAHLGQYEDETSYLCHWHLPQAHELEAWGDARAFDGTVTIQQPLIAPLYGGRTASEFLANVTGQPGRSAYDILRTFWKTRLGEADFEKKWRRSIHDGLVEGTSLPMRVPRVLPDFAGKAKPIEAPEKLEIVYRADPNVFDGRFANNGWLQELSRPVTKLTWENVCMVSPKTAERLGLRSEDVAELTYEGRKLRAPVWVTPGHADESATLFLGFGRQRSGRVGTGNGYNAYSIRIAASSWICGGLEVRGTGARTRLATTQEHWALVHEQQLERRHIFREGSIEDFRKEPDVFHKMGHEPPKSMTLYPDEHKYNGYAWGMTIDLNACTGCNSCVVACQAENNIPVVGKDQVAAGREMQWIRVDRYYKGGLENPSVYHQPVPCMQCENAPCEVVCPVAATSHSDEGLNDMTYNRCVGTRYCSNNCPYKVRRFNFLQYSDTETPVLKLLRNPDVTVRNRGVMEKCTYCVQRINAARITAEKEGRQIRDGEIVTACQQVCPAQAITFGNINDKASAVTKRKDEERNYSLLGDLNTRPRTTYLAKLCNPNPEITG